MENTLEYEIYGKPFLEAAAGKWRPISADELNPGMQMRDASGNAVEVLTVSPSANDCVFVQCKGRTGVHIPKAKVALVK